MTKPEVDVDVDGVLGDFLKPAMELANRMFGFKHKPEDLDQWDMVPFMGLTKEQEEAFFEELERPGFHAHIKPYPGAVEGMKALGEVAKVHILTSPLHGPTWCSERWHWLKRDFSIKARDVTFTHEKHRFVGAMIVDDKPANVERWVQHQQGIGVLWHQPYTAKLTPSVHPRIERVDNWERVVTLAKQLAA